MERRSAWCRQHRHTPQPLITVAITCYEAEDTIVRAVESALAQTWLEREILVVDDGSTDRSVALLEELCAYRQCA
jgi:glycosyltransferase involved in cell wall biosynthesis